MGSSKGLSYEKPVHSVTLSPFSMSRCEITYAQWVKVRDWGKSHGYSFNQAGVMGDDNSGSKMDENHPVTNIEWYDAVLWCNALSEMEGRTPCYYTSASQSTVYRSGRTNIQSDWVKWNANGYRLPTEAEWEYACRAGTTTDYSTADSIGVKDANYNSYGTMPVGSYAANPWGLYDMHGNVWEWCWDWAANYDSGAVNNPRGPSSGSRRVIRGGSWIYYMEDLRSANRCGILPDGGWTILGFRLVHSQLIGKEESC
jgi:formylglycine-generating enzyme required for sulfatase activity